MLKLGSNATAAVLVDPATTCESVGMDLYALN